MLVSNLHKPFVDETLPIVIVGFVMANGIIAGV